MPSKNLVKSPRRGRAPLVLFDVVPLHLFSRPYSEWCAGLSVISALITMRLSILLFVLVTTSAGAYQMTRRGLLRGIGGAAPLFAPASAWAVIGNREQAGKPATQAGPAFLPSPIRPTGELAKSCEVVALGREDICLEPKKPPSAYEQLQISRALEDLEGSSGPGAAKAKALLQAVSSADWDVCSEELVDPAGLSKGLVEPLKAACKKKDGPSAAKAVLKLANEL